MVISAHNDSRIPYVGLVIKIPSPWGLWVTNPVVFAVISNLTMARFGTFFLQWCKSGTLSVETGVVNLDSFFL